MKIQHLKNKWVTSIDDVDCANLSPDEKKEIYSLFAERKVLIIKNQQLTNPQLKNFCSIFGNLWDESKELFSGLSQSNNEFHEDSFVELVSESGILENIRIPWHVDLTHFPSQLIPNRVLYAVELSDTAAGTQFLDTVQGLDLIDPQIKKFLSTATALCKAPYETPWNCYVRRPAINWHPIHNQYGLVADQLFTQWIEGLPEGTNYKEWIKTHVIDKMHSDETLYIHNWELHDLLIYDNWSTIHFRDSFSGIRKLKRVTWDQNWYTYGKEI